LVEVDFPTAHSNLNLRFDAREEPTYLEDDAEILDSMINLLQGLKETAPLEIIEQLVPDANEYFGQLDSVFITWKVLIEQEMLRYEGTTY
jgi:hypothetical protein